MNCKPGDLAVIVKALPVGDFLLGRIVEVLHADGAGWWWVRLQNQITNPVVGTTGDEGSAPDECLHPIRPQGDDAQDESRLYLPPVPTNTPAKEVDHA